MIRELPSVSKRVPASDPRHREAGIFALAALARSGP